MTTSPNSNEEKRPLDRATYPRSDMADKVGTYVLGRPIPFSSRALINVPSVYKGGGSVKCWLGVMDCDVTRSFSFKVLRLIAPVSYTHLTLPTILRV